MIDRESTLIDVAFAACTALHSAGIGAVLSGGAAATYYASSAYQSRDLDFILRFATSKKSVTSALATISFHVDATNIYKNENTAYTIEFPPGPLMIGSHHVENWKVVERGPEMLNILEVTDCVSDRFMGFYAWGDYGSLEAALAVARTRRSDFDLERFSAWATSEAKHDPAYDLGRLTIFCNELG